MEKKIVYIMRGVPGSGKSTLAKVLTGTTGTIHSTDDFFYVDGEYVFEPELLREYHNLNFTAFCQSLKEDVPIVVLDNTNTQRWQYGRYVDSAKKAGYEVRIVILQHPTPEVAASRTLHGVPMESIRRMIAGWEN